MRSFLEEGERVRNETTYSMTSKDAKFHFCTVAKKRKDSHFFLYSKRGIALDYFIGHVFSYSKLFYAHYITYLKKSVTNIVNGADFRETKMVF